MKKPVVLCLALAAAFSLAKADQVIEYPAKDPIFSIAFPDGWKVETGDSVSASSKDDLLNMELIALDADALDGAIDVAKESLKEEFKGIKFLDKPEKGELNGMPAIFLNANATMEDVKMAVNCCIFAPKGADTFFMLFNVVPLEVLKEHGEDISKVLNSVKPEK